MTARLFYLVSLAAIAFSVLVVAAAVGLIALSLRVDHVNNRRILQRLRDQETGRK